MKHHKGRWKTLSDVLKEHIILPETMFEKISKISTEHLNERVYYFPQEGFCSCGMANVPGHKCGNIIDGTVVEDGKPLLRSGKEEDGKA